VTPPPPNDQASYKQAYATLSRIAARLEDGETDLDTVLPLLQEAQAAYAVCQERIEAVRAALGSPPDVLDEDEDDDDDEDDDADVF
jgi:exodeoxyribonuclease VII small subunit